jgi:hypothetical protein
MKTNRPPILLQNTQTAYESTVTARAILRAGANPHLKGHIHEILLRDSKNFKSLLNGQSTALTKSATAKTVDLVTTKGGKVIERIQAKDCISDSSIRDIVDKVRSGQYRSAKLVGTEETTARVNAALKKAGLSKRMSSSGVKTADTTRMAQRVGASGSGTLASATWQAAKAGGAAGAVIGAGIETVKGISDLMDGTRDGGEVAWSVAKAGGKGYATGAAAGAAATAGGAAVASGLAAIGAGAGVTAIATAAAPIALAVGVGYLVSSVWDSIFD